MVTVGYVNTYLKLYAGVAEYYLNESSVYRMGERGLDFVFSGQEAVAKSFKLCNEFSDSINSGKFLDQLRKF